MTNKCVWLLSNAGEFPARVCGKSVRYTIVKDDDENLRRKYASFCDEHQKLADAEDAREETE